MATNVEKTSVKRKMREGKERESVCALKEREGEREREREKMK